MRKRRFTMVLTVVALMMAVAAPAALAGPPKAAFYDNDAAWACEDEAGLPADHCINANGKGSTGTIMVFEDGFGPQESYSVNPQAANRSCPDRGETLGATWFEIDTGLWVCHH
jgi:hypothetical protein